MQYNVKWIINGNITIELTQKKKQKKSRKMLEDIINNNKEDFKSLEQMQYKDLQIKLYNEKKNLEKEFGKF